MFHYVLFQLPLSVRCKKTTIQIFLFPRNAKNNVNETVSSKKFYTTDDFFILLYTFHKNFKFHGELE